MRFSKKKKKKESGNGIAKLIFKEILIETATEKSEDSSGKLS